MRADSYTQNRSDDRYLVIDDSDETTEPTASSDSAKTRKDRSEKPSLDAELADENLFRRLLRELQEETSKPGETTRSTSDE